jgi:hypothetical protein
VFYAQPTSGAVYAHVTGLAYSPTAGAMTTITATTAAPQFDTTFTNVPSGLALLTARRESGGLLMSQYISSPTATTVAHYTGPVGLAATFISIFEKPVTAQGYAARQYVYEAAPPSMTTHTLDASATLLKWIDQPTFDMSTRKLTVPTSTTGMDGDLAAVFLAYGAPGGPLTWEIFTASPQDLTLPTIPMSVADVTPTSAGSPEVMLFESDHVNGFAEAHLDPHTLWNGDAPVPRPLTGSRMSYSPRL